MSNMMASQKVSQEVNTHLEELPDHSRGEYLNMAPYQDAQDHQLLNQLFALESRDASAAA
ncbi:hypothetical protein [Paenibacillus luteus]|uniref:hypothetical protein n=1 Tax=Paenibacillus luteus TaxID=2545753 RepID=UPI0019D520CA|nr:hypothetical protein [Paenibacillus luteus]